MRTTPAPLLALTLMCTALAAGATPAPSRLTGFALLPAGTFSDGPTSGQFAGPGAGGNPLPLIDRQPVQGFSSVLHGPTADSFIVLTDNGFGTQANSADTLLRLYALRPDWRTASGGSGTVLPVGFTDGSAQPAFNAATRITLADPDRRLGFGLQADLERYYGQASNPLVDPTIRSGRLLTGADLDNESVRQDKNGNFWFGEEFGPFIYKADASGKVLAREVALPGVQSPQNPYLGGNTPTLGASRGFEGMAINPAGDRLYTLLEGTVAGDPAGTLRINRFDIDSESWASQAWRYKLEPQGTAIGEMTAIDEHRFIVIERNGATATSGGTPFKKLFTVDLRHADASGNLVKTELVDLMNIADPDDLNGDGSTVFTFPYVTIESVLILDERTLLVINDNNFPGTGGRSAASDATEFIRIELAQPIPEPGTWALMAAGLTLLLGAARQNRR